MSFLGNIYESSLKELVYKEILEGDVWLNNRANISPCDKCINRMSNHIIDTLDKKEEYIF